MLFKGLATITFIYGDLDGTLGIITDFGFYDEPIVMHIVSAHISRIAITTPTSSASDGDSIATASTVALLTGGTGAGKFASGNTGVSRLMLTSASVGETSTSGAPCLRRTTARTPLGKLLSYRDNNRSLVMINHSFH